MKKFPTTTTPETTERNKSFFIRIVNEREEQRVEEKNSESLKKRKIKFIHTHNALNKIGQANVSESERKNGKKEKQENR